MNNDDREQVLMKVRMPVLPMSCRRPIDELIAAPLSKVIFLLLGCALLLSPGMGWAQWGKGQQSIAGLRAWVYKPKQALPSGKHALMIVLHGCAQTNTELKKEGNIAASADEVGAVVALPQVPANNNYGCWDYDHGVDFLRHGERVIKLTQTLVAKASLHIDPRHVYVLGLSSGAAMGIQVACAAPELFAGIGELAGPVVGSSQALAISDFSNTEPDSVSDGVSKCLKLAGPKADHLRTQVANVGHGLMDLNGAEQAYRPCGTLSIVELAYTMWGLPDDSPACTADKHPGQTGLVSVKWTQEAARMFVALYGTGSLGSAVDVQGGKAIEQSAEAGGRSRVALLQVKNVGHAWPAGTGRSNGPGGQWIAQSGLNYPQYIMHWLLEHNVRVPRPPAGH